MCQCKEQMGQILNYVMMNGSHTMTEAIYNIYSTVKPWRDILTSCPYHFILSFVAYY